jgi:ribosomal protein S18 acetylase RimI-like enzyme
MIFTTKANDKNPPWSYGFFDIMKINTEDMVIEPAGPDQAEAAWKLIYATDPHLFDCYFDKNIKLAQACLMQWWQEKSGWFSHAGCHVAKYETALVGIEICFDRKEILENVRPTFMHAKETMKSDAFKHFSNIFGDYVQYLFPTIPKDAYYVQSLAAADSVRGQGIGYRLLLQIFDRASRRGFRQCQLDVASDNPAVDFYRRMGMTSVSESRVPHIEKAYGVCVHYRMRKKL